MAGNKFKICATDIHMIRTAGKTQWALQFDSANTSSKKIWPV